MDMTPLTTEKIEVIRTAFLTYADGWWGQKPGHCGLLQLLAEVYGAHPSKSRNEWDFTDFPNDSFHRYKVTGEMDDLSFRDLEEAVRVKEIDPLTTQVMLDDLARKGIIEKGEYLIEMMW